MEQTMRRALELAATVRASTSPNPWVGCVIEPGGFEGATRPPGDDHAEIVALKAAGGRAAGATMVVTLEPCNHHGRTPPCVDAILAAGIARVVIAMRDPHEIASGGVDKLRDAGIEVIEGVLEPEARKLNEVFIHAVTHHRPFVVLKAGMTLDGKLATVTRESRWITSDAARQKSLELREEYDAILTGAGTIVDDNPQLTRRLGLASTPWTRIILDRRRLVPADATVLTDGGNTLHITEDVDLDALLADLYTRGIHSLIVEGGSNVLSSFIRQLLWQKMMVFIAPMFVGGAEAPAIFGGEGVAKLADANRFRVEGVEV